MEKLTGQCLCGAIHYEVNGGLGPVYNCHCSKCRRWHGSAFRTRASVETKKFKWVSGEQYVKRYTQSDNVTKTFCSICGSNLISLYKSKPNFIGLPIGALEQDPGNRPLGHIFTDSKSPWYEISDDLPQHDTWPASADAVRGEE